MILKRIIILFFSAFFSVLSSNSTSEVVAIDDIKWGHLNPLRGKASPGAADLWGDRTKDGETGMLVRFKKGFSSPPHIHNITYRGVVIKGLLHNDDPNAKKMWMPTGSYWTQPAGEEHITAAAAEENMIYLEINSGPYLVKPSKEQFDNGEVPINVHKSNIVWLDASDAASIDASGVKTTFLWGKLDSNEPVGSIVKLPANYKGQIITDASKFRAVIIEGEINYKSIDISKEKNLKAGSYFGSSGNFKHVIYNSKNSEVILYISANSRYKVK